MKGGKIERTKTLPNYMQYSIAIIVVVIAVLASLNIGNSTRTILSAIEVWPKPENVSELFFTKPTALPTNFTPGSPMEVDFTLHNVESRDITYDYKIEQLDSANNKTTELKTGALSLSDSEKSAEKIVVSPINSKGTSRFSITVTYPSSSDSQKAKQLSISYWLKNSKEV